MKPYPPVEYPELNAAEQPLATEFIQDNLFQPVTMFLTNGVKLSGAIMKNDAQALTLTRDGNTQLVYKHAIATIMPQDA
jgi:RNA chaperone Hfq